MADHNWNVDTVATELLACEAERRDRVKFTDEWPELDVETGYQIQDETLRRRLERGEQLIGVKLGLTSRAKQERMGVSTPFVAWLTDAMVLAADLPVPQDKLPVLFPEAYRPAAAPQVAGGGIPRSLLYAGLGTLAFCLLAWLALFLYAGTVSRSAEDAVRPAVRAEGVRR